MPAVYFERNRKMAIAFDKILIPVDFSLNTEIAVKKAAALVGSGEAVLHLLHVVRPGKQAVHQFKVWAVEKELERWKDDIRRNYPALRVKTYVLKGTSTPRMIVECAGMLKPDLIIIAKQNKGRRWTVVKGISPDHIARKSNCPVLTVKPGSLDSRTKIIVIPIRDFLPERKLEWGVLLARKYKAQVHLLAIRDNPEPGQRILPPVFLKAYHHLRENLHHPIEYSTAGQHSPARAALRYAEMIMADMILVNPRTESGIPGFAFSRHISDLLARDSKIQVLDVEPYRSPATEPATPQKANGRTQGDSRTAKTNGSQTKNRNR
jgi:nucleotide-binding universal stress UspA family protein